MIDPRHVDEVVDRLDGYTPDADLGLGCGLPTEFARIEPGDVVLDFDACLALRGDEEIPVTSREWGILKLLGAKPGRIVSRATILDSVWDDQSEGASASLDTLMGRIRRKLGASVIRTVRSEGYALGGV